MNWQLRAAIVNNKLKLVRPPLHPLPTQIIRHHPNFTYNGFDTVKNDIAVVKLRRPVKGLSPVHLPTSAERAMPPLLTVMGWGKTEQGDFPGTLR
jgi:hypothetical protein